MENQLPAKQANTEKKQWIAPEMQEINVNGGAAYLTYESTSYMS